MGDAKVELGDEVAISQGGSAIFPVLEHFICIEQNFKIISFPPVDLYLIGTITRRSKDESRVR